MTKFTQFGGLLSLFILLLVGCKKENSPPEPEQELFESKLQGYYNLFNRTKGWVGGDIASSIPISEEKTLWLFGDTWNGCIENNERTNFQFTAHNTIAIQNGKTPENAILDYYFGDNSSGTFFEPSDGIGQIWPLQGIMVNAELYIFFVQIEVASNDIGFELIGSRIVKVSNPLSPPAQWQMTQYQVPHSSFSSTEQIVFGEYVVQKNGYAYLYGTKTDNASGNRHLLLARTPLDSITSFSSWKFYTQGLWQDNFVISDHLIDRVGFEFSVSYHSSINKYILVYSDLGISQNISVRYSDSLWGDWSASENIYRCPEPDWNNNFFCYAAKGHPELTNDNELIITYVANSWELYDVVKDARLYWPRFIKIDL